MKTLTEDLPLCGTLYQSATIIQVPLNELSSFNLMWELTVLMLVFPVVNMLYRTDPVEAVLIEAAKGATTE